MAKKNLKELVSETPLGRILTREIPFGDDCFDVAFRVPSLLELSQVEGIDHFMAEDENAEPLTLRDQLKAGASLICSLAVEPQFSMENEVGRTNLNDLPRATFLALINAVSEVVSGSVKGEPGDVQSTFPGDGPS